MFVVFSHVAEDDRCLIDFNFLSVDDDPCFHRFSQNALWIQHVGCFAQERLVSVMLLIQLAWHTLTTLKLHSGKLTYCGKSPILMGKSTISMVIFNSYVSLPEGTIYYHGLHISTTTKRAVFSGEILPRFAPTQRTVSCCTVGRCAAGTWEPGSRVFIFDHHSGLWMNEKMDATWYHGLALK